MYTLIVPLNDAPAAWIATLHTDEGPIRFEVANAGTHIEVVRPHETPVEWSLESAWECVIACLMDGRIRLPGIEHEVQAGMVEVRKRVAALPLARAVIVPPRKSQSGAYELVAGRRVLGSGYDVEHLEWLGERMGFDVHRCAE